MQNLRTRSKSSTVLKQHVIEMQTMLPDHQASSVVYSWVRLLLPVCALVLILWRLWHVSPSNEIQPLEKHAFAFVLTNVRYECMTRVAVRSLQNTGATEPIVLMTTLEDVAPFDNVRIRRVTLPPTLGRGKWTDTFAKLWVARLPFERVIYFDSDVLFHRSPSFLFHVDPEDGIASPEAYWEDGAAIRTDALRPEDRREVQPISSSGPLIVRPHRVLFGDVLDSSHLSRVYERDTGYLNDFYGPTALILPQHVAVMIDEFIPGTPRFHRRGGTLQMYMLVHFNDEWNPTLISGENIIEAYPQSSLVADEFEAWHLLQLQVCLF